MTDNLTPTQREQIREALTAKAEHEAELAAVQDTRRALAPIWERLAAVPDTFGLELEVALVPRGTR